MKKTNAMRLLDSAGIPYKPFEYGFDPDHLSASKVAAQLGVDVSLLFKTLVLKGEPGGVFVCIIAGDNEVDLKKAAAVSGNKNAAMVPMKELFFLTGYIRGGCTPIGMEKKYPLYIDSSCLGHDHIFISAGVRGIQLKIAVGDLIGFTGGEVAELT